MYFVEDLVGLPGIEPEDIEALLEPPGIAAKIVELLFLVLAIIALGKRGRAA